MACDLLLEIGAGYPTSFIRQENPGMARILVFDADAPIRNLLREMLELEGYDVVEADNAYEGIQQAQARPMELAMPEIAYLIAF
jgi:CheY-like chemotaxis protein